MLDQPEVVNLQTYTGTASPYNFNGLVRHYYLRRGSNIGRHPGQSAAQERPQAAEPRDRETGASAPHCPSPPNTAPASKSRKCRPDPRSSRLSSPKSTAPAQPGQIDIARQIRDLCKRTDGVVDVDWYVEDDQPKFHLVVDREKAALNGISAEDVARTLSVASAGFEAGLLHADSAKEDVPIIVRLDRASRSDLAQLQNLKIAGRAGRLVPLSEIVRVEKQVAEKSIYHKNLMPVTYVTADIAGAMESPVYADPEARAGDRQAQDPWRLRARAEHGAPCLSTTERYSMKWDGEWHITYEVFRDLGIAFAAVLILIYVLVVGWFQSFITPLVIMAAIPFSLVGILPAHGLMGAFFTATSHDRVHRRGRYRGPQLHHPGGLRGTAAGRGHAAR